MFSRFEPSGSAYSAATENIALETAVSYKDDRKIKLVIRQHLRVLIMPSFILVALTALGGYMSGLSIEPRALLTAWALAALLLWVRPLWRWATRTLVVDASGVSLRRAWRRKPHMAFSHAQNYTVQVRRGPIALIFGTGTLILTGPVSTSPSNAEGSEQKLIFRSTPQATVISGLLEELQRLHRDQGDSLNARAIRQEVQAQLQQLLLALEKS